MKVQRFKDPLDYKSVRLLDCTLALWSGAPQPTTFEERSKYRELRYVSHSSAFETKTRTVLVCLTTMSADEWAADEVLRTKDLAVRKENLAKAQNRKVLNDYV